MRWALLPIRAAGHRTLRGLAKLACLCRLARRRLARRDPAADTSNDPAKFKPRPGDGLECGSRGLSATEETLLSRLSPRDRALLFDALDKISRQAAGNGGGTSVTRLDPEGSGGCRSKPADLPPAA